MGDGGDAGGDSEANVVEETQLLHWTVYLPGVSSLRLIPMQWKTVRATDVSLIPPVPTRAMGSRFSARETSSPIVLRVRNRP